MPKERSVGRQNIKDSFIKMMKIADRLVTLYCSESPYPDFWDWKG